MIGYWRMSRGLKFMIDLIVILYESKTKAILCDGIVVNDVKDHHKPEFASLPCFSLSKSTPITLFGH